MYLMLQQEESNDYAIAKRCLEQVETRESYKLAESIEIAFGLVELDWREYVEIDCYSKGKHLTRAGDFSAIKMGKNDLWIAATASVYECKLLTTDLDFGHLRDEFVDVVYITPDTFR